MYKKLNAVFLFSIFLCIIAISSCSKNDGDPPRSFSAQASSKGMPSPSEIADKQRIANANSGIDAPVKSVKLIKSEQETSVIK